MGLDVYTESEIEAMCQRGEATMVHRYLVLVPIGEGENPGTIHANITLATEKAEEASKKFPATDILILESNPIPRTLDGTELRNPEIWSLANIFTGGEMRTFSNTLQDMILGFEE